MSMSELLPFDDEPEPIIHLRDPRLVKEETPRLSRQCRQILERLQRGPATNKELSAIALKYTGRISDLRASGYNIEVSKRDHKTGVTVYKLRR